MKLGLLLFACLAPVTSCGGRSQGDPGSAAMARPSPGSQSCLTSEVCPNGMRCDFHWCVPDMGCPPLQSPDLLFEPEAGGPWAGRSAYVFGMDGHELLMSLAYDLSATHLSFHDLTTGEDSTLEHPPGRAYCVTDPVTCFATDYSAFTLFQDLSSSARTWVAGSERRYAIAGSPGGTAADRSARQIPIWDSTARTLSLLDLDSGSTLFALPLPGALLAMLTDAQGRTASIEVTKSSSSDTVIQSAPLRDGSTFELVYRGEPTKFSSVLLTNGDPRYAVRENGITDAYTARVERVVNAVPETLGTFADPPLASLGLELTSTALEPGSATYALDCSTDRQCRSFLIHLDPLSVESIAQAPWPDGRPVTVANIRRLACGARDLVLSTSEGAATTSRFWSLRLPGRAGLP